MWIPIISTGTIVMLLKICTGLDLIELPYQEQENMREMKTEVKRTRVAETYAKVKMSTSEEAEEQRVMSDILRRADEQNYESEKDANIKAKISTLVQQTILDTEMKLKSILPLKEKHRDLSPYRVGFILSMIKKTKDVLNELFNVAMKHRDEWKALDQLKIFELIVHTNVDTTNLVRQLVEIHIQYKNNNSSSSSEDKKRVVVI